MKNLFVVAHPDDEVLGAGAFIYDALRRGDEMAVAVLNTCDETRYEDDRKRIVTDMSVSHQMLGGNIRVFKFDYPDGNFHLADHRKMVQDIEGVIRVFEPDNIFTQHTGDINSDHTWTAYACMEAFRIWQRGREDVHPVSALYLMEVQSSTDWALDPSADRFKPNTFFEVSESGVAAMIDSLKVYEGVVRPHPHPRSVESLEALSILRGSQAGVHRAQAFQCVFRAVRAT